MLRLWQFVEQDLVHSLYCIPIGHLGTVQEENTHIFITGVTFFKLLLPLTDRKTYSTGSPPAIPVEVSHGRGRSGHTPTGLDSSSLPPPSCHSDTPPLDTATGTPQERPGGHNAEKHWRSATHCSWTKSAHTHTLKMGQNSPTTIIATSVIMMET